MQYQRAEAPARPPVLLGCLGILAALLVLAIAAGSCVVFLESGADAGDLVLDPAELYAPGSVTYLGEDNVFIVRLPDGVFHALNNLDQPNRATPGARCRVRSVSIGDPTIAARYDAVRESLSPAADGATVIFTEDCNGAIYDLTGILLGAEGFNLDHHPVSIRDDGRLVVDLSERICTTRTATQLAATVDCPNP
ncbi:MAG TPA: hypothetical protein VFK32_07125 [Tepidiformaceae bacterium]|nr:hypothetical protein [Tepidiformaceae bacterium]